MPFSSIPYDPRLKLVVKKTTETINNSAVLQDDNELAFNLVAERIYFWRLYLNFVADAAADFRLCMVAPAWNIKTNYVDMQSNARAYGTNHVINATGSSQFWECFGDLVTVGGGGTFKLQWAQWTAHASDCIVYQGSKLLLYDLGAR